MTRFSPCLIVKRMVVKRGQHRAYDETFHIGVNVVRGDNSSGKSTILNFIFYGLGGDLSREDWSDYALLCDSVWLEVEFNGQPAVLRRLVDSNSQSGMEIFGGRLPDAEEAPVEAWIRYPYSRSKNQESFSQALFRLLEMPDVAVEGTSNITIHQILRLLYADQLTPIDNIFRFEGYDPENLREAVGNLLCGAFDTEIYELQQLVRTKERDFTDAQAELKSIFRVVGGEESMSVEWITQKRTSLLSERESTLARIASAEEALYSGAKSEKISLVTQQRLYKQVQSLQAELQAARRALDGLEYEIADSNSFLATLRSRLEALRDADAAAKVVEVIHFGVCPACYAEITESDHEVAACHLCKTPLDSDRAKDRVVGLINETAIQIKQSERLQVLRADRARALADRIADIEASWRLKAAELSSVSALPTSKAREELRELQRSLGYIDKSIEDVERQARLANKIGDLSAKKATLESDIKDLNARIEALKRSQTDRLRIARASIEKRVIAILKGDLKRQDSFQNPEHVDFSFLKNTIRVDGHTYFSASSRVVLKTAFLLGFLQAALYDSEFRHPRFLMIDITEDKGMEMERSHNFQRQVIEISQAAPVEHQIILATAMPWSGIDASLFVGRHSTLASGTLSIARPAAST